jgi:C-terminal peptidase prc
VRLPTPLPTVYAADMLSTKGGVGYLRLAGFQEQTPRELDDVILELKARGMKSLVIDLRGNPGGLFTSALAVAKLFLPAGLIASTLGQSPEFAGRVFSSESGMAAYDVPVVLLVDTKTMSAAEILAAGLKDNHRATLVGLPTFGKGFVQSPVRLHTLDGTDDLAAVNKSGVLILSVASVLGPRGIPLNGTGVTPHVTEPNADRQLAIAVQKATELAGGPPVPMIMR